MNGAPHPGGPCSGAARAGAQQVVTDADLPGLVASNRLARIDVNGAMLYGDPSGALWWPAQRTLLVTDLHLEKGSGLTRRGAGVLPPYDTRETLRRLARAMARFRPVTVISLGDGFHDGDAANRLDPADGATLASLTVTCDWVWIAGNHDPAPPEHWGGRVAEALTVPPLVCRHEADPDQPHGELSGHYHPKARVRTRARAIAGRCFVGDGRRLILPSFGAYTGGLNVLNPAIARLFRVGFTAHVIGRDRLFAFTRAKLLARP